VQPVTGFFVRARPSCAGRFTVNTYGVTGARSHRKHPLHDVSITRNKTVFGSWLESIVFRD
jgi:hypothetical protein